MLYSQEIVNNRQLNPNNKRKKTNRGNPDTSKKGLVLHS